MYLLDMCSHTGMGPSSLTPRPRPGDSRVSGYDDYGDDGCDGLETRLTREARTIESPSQTPDRIIIPQLTRREPFRTRLLHRIDLWTFLFV